MTQDFINKFIYKINSNITIVTGFFRMNSKFTQHTYNMWMDTFLKLDEFMVIFTDTHNYDYISSRRNTSNTYIIITSIENFVVAKYIHYWKYCHSIDLEKGYHSTDLYMIWNEKTYFIDKAINLNPFNCDYFFWMANLRHK